MSSRCSEYYSIIFFDYFFKPDENKEKNKEKAKELVDRFEELYHYLHNLKPLFLNMIAGIIEDGPEFELSHATLYLVYDNFVRKILERTFQSVRGAGTDSKILFMKTIVEFLMNKSLETILHGRNFRGMSNIDMISRVFGEIPPLSMDQLARLGLMYDDGEGKLFFVHQTFAEYFAVEFFIEEVVKNNNEQSEVSELMVESLRRNELVLKFFNEKVEDYKTNGKFEAAEWFTKIVRKFENKFFMFKRFTNHGCMNLIKLASVSLMEDREELLDYWMRPYKGSILMFPSIFQPSSFTQILFAFAETIFYLEEMKKLLMCRSKFRHNILHYSLMNKDEKFFELIVKRSRYFFKESEEDLENFFSPPLWAIKKMKRSLELCKKTFKAEEFQKMVLLNNSMGETLLHAVSREKDDDVFEFVAEIFKTLNNEKIKEIIPKVNESEMTFMMVTAEKRKFKRFQDSWNFVKNYFDEEDLKEFLLMEDDKKRNILRISMLNKQKEMFFGAVELYKDMFGIEIVDKMLGKR